MCVRDSILLLVAIPALLAATNDAQTEATKKELARLQGAWKLTAVEENGRESVLPEKDQTNWFVKGKAFCGPDGKQLSTVQLDPTTRPKSIDFSYAADPAKMIEKLVREGIYLLEGDTWKTCVNTRTQGVKERPSEFSTKDRPGWRLLVFKRQSP
ncbi:MAG: TIGR03067 domain-containing protein [Gemmataceae bacterium]|nr:TIGR03067 domain-containing protein [Gemmataceae bacterium]MCI0743110.1 TIGR03067 domain-containing protein [Gemmataceae bacterium]